MNHDLVFKEIARGLLALQQRIAAAKIPSSKSSARHGARCIPTCSSPPAATADASASSTINATLWIQIIAATEGFKLEQIVRG